MRRDAFAVFARVRFFLDGNFNVHFGSLLSSRAVRFFFM